MVEYRQRLRMRPEQFNTPSLMRRSVEFDFHACCGRRKRAEQMPIVLIWYKFRWLRGLPVCFWPSLGNAEEDGGEARKYWTEYRQHWMIRT